jgi:hypothetical protein
MSEKNETNIYSIKFTNINHEYSLRKIFEECIFLKIGEIVEIVLSCYLNNKQGEPRKSEAYVYFKPTNSEFVEKVDQMGVPFPFVYLDDNEEPWYIEKNQVMNHFRTDPYEQKRILIQSIKSSKNGSDINFIFRALLILFGFVISALIIAWIVYNIQNLSGDSSIISFILNILIVIIVLALIYKTINVELPKGNAQKNYFFETILLCPAIIKP